MRAAVRVARSWFLFLEAEELLPGKNPMGRVKLPKLSRHILPAFSQDDVRGLLAAAEQTPTPERDAAISSSGRFRAARQRACGLTWGDVDFNHRAGVHPGRQGDKDR